jgi:WD40 repeat protein
MAAFCLDDRRRKIIIGDMSGRILVYNPSNGAYMKAATTEADTAGAAVSSLVYLDDKRWFIGAFNNGVIKIYDENRLEDCTILKVFDHHYKHTELFCMVYDEREKSIITSGATGEPLKFWDLDNGKVELSIQTLPPTSAESVVRIEVLNPFPLVATADSAGGVNIWGTRSCVYPGARMNGFRNQTPDEAIFEMADSVQDKSEKYHRIVIPKNGPAVDAEGSKIRSQDPLDDFPKENESVDSASFHDEANADDMSAAGSSTVQHGSKWGPVSSAVAMAWDPDEQCLYTGDELGYLRKWSLEALIKELMKNNSQATTKVVGVEDEPSQENVLTAVKVLSALGSMGNHDECRTKHTGLFEWAVSAHEESILYCCRCPSGLFTSSTDRLVKMWSFEGFPIGQLFHSVPAGVRSEYWNLELDVHRLMDAENKELDGVMTDVNEFFHRPDVPEIDKSNLTSMVPGFEAAKYSQSSFRKIIDRSGLILGIDLDEQQHQEQPDDISVQSQSSKSSQDALKELKGKYNPDKKSKKVLNEADTRRHANNLKKVAEKYGKTENGTKLPYVKVNVSQTIPEGDEEQHTDPSLVNSATETDPGAGAVAVLSHKEKTAATDDAKQRARNAEIDRRCKKYTSFAALDEALLGKPAVSNVSQQPSSRSASVDITAIRQKRLSTISILTQSNGGRKFSRLPSLTGNQGALDEKKLSPLLSMSMSALSTFNKEEGERSGVFDGEGERSGPLDNPVERQSSAASDF